MYRAAVEEETKTVESLTNKSRVDESLSDIGTIQSFVANS